MPPARPNVSPALFPPMRPRCAKRKTTLLISLLAACLASPLAASNCVNGIDTLTGLACIGEGDGDLTVFAPDTVAYTEVRGESGIVVIVLHDGTLIAMDVFAELVAVTKPNAQPVVTGVRALDSALQRQFSHLAGLIRSNPTFDMEIALGRPAYIPGRTHPLSFGDLGLPISGQQKSFNERSPCRNDRCRRVEVTGWRATYGTILTTPVGLDNPPPPRPVVPTCGPGVPQAVCDDKWRTDRQSFDRWREGRCNDAALNGALFATSGASTWLACVSPAVVLVAPCVISAISYAITAVTTGLAARDCASTYRGPGTWP